MVVGVAYLDEVEAAYAPLARKYKADEAADQAQREGFYVCTGGVVSASATQGKLDLAAGTDFVGTTELNYAAQAAQPGCLTAISTAVAAGSNTQTVSGLTSGQLVVGSTGGGAPAAGLLAVVRAGVVISCIAYTSIGDATHFNGVSLVSGWTNITFASATDTVVVVNNDLTAMKWLDVEVDASGVYQTAVGSAGGATTAVKPALTSSRTLHASLLLQPVSGNTSALSIDELTTTANGKSKLMQGRRLVTVHPSRQIGLDAGKTNTNPTSLTSVLNSTISVPANSPSVGDVYIGRMGGLYGNTQNASTAEFQFLWGSTTVLDWTTASLAANGSFRSWSIEFKARVTAVGASVTLQVEIKGQIGVPANGAFFDTVIAAGGVTVSTTSAQALDLKTKMTTSSSTSTITCNMFSVEKLPV